MSKEPEKPAKEAKPKNPHQRILDGDETAIPEFRELLRTHPKIVEIYAQKPLELLLMTIADMNHTIAAGAPLLYRETLTAKMDSLRAELACPQPSPIERLLVERVVACWLQVYDADFQCSLRGEAAVAQATYDLQRQDRAHRRYLSAIKTLATVRRLALPIQVDLNVAGTVKTESTTPVTMPDRFKLSPCTNN